MSKGNARGMQDDTISRSAVLGIAFKYCPDDDGTCSEAGTDLRDMLDELEALPSTQPERIKGRWILAKEQRREDIENGNYMYNCSNCDCGDLHSRAVNVSYCWNCGADMTGAHDD